MNGEFQIGPFPDIGGPFDTAVEFFEAWANHAKFRQDEDKVLKLMNGHPLAGELLQSIKAFPSLIKEKADVLTKRNHGPFPVCHRDFLHSNIIVNDNFEALAIIDWEHASTLPVELLNFPDFLSVAPARFGPPEYYDENGEPVDDMVKGKLKERMDYIRMVRSAEQGDHLLSECLSDRKSMDLAYSMSAFLNGKLGLYSRVIE